MPCASWYTKFSVLLGKQELILLDEPEAQNDLISFDEPPAEKSKSGEKVVVVAKHISTKQSNNVSHKPFSAFDSVSRKTETTVKPEQVRNHEPVEHHEYETTSDSPPSQLYWKCLDIAITECFIFHSCWL